MSGVREIQLFEQRPVTLCLVSFDDHMLAPILLGGSPTAPVFGISLTN